MKDANGKLHIRMVDLDSIVVPHEYQRDFRPAKAQKIIEDFRPEECGVLPITDRADGTYACTEGQHRLFALKALGYTQWLCQVMAPRSLAEEAELFVDMNTRRTALTGGDKWRARRVAEDPIVLAIEAIAEGLDLVVDPRNRHRQPNCVRATTALERVYKSMGPQYLTSTLKVVKAAWPDDPEAMKGPMILGVASFLLYYEDDPAFKRSEVVDKFSAFPSKRILQRAAEIGGSSQANTSYNAGSSYSFAPGVVRALAQAYNYKRHKNILEDPTIRGWKAVTTKHQKKAAA